MRLVLTVGLYLAYIRNFCDYLLTGKVDYHPANPAGLLGQASSIDQLLARPDGLLLCGIFALGCYGVSRSLVTFVYDGLTALVHGNSHLDSVILAAPSDSARSANIGLSAKVDKSMNENSTHNIG